MLDRGVRNTIKLHNLNFIFEDVKDLLCSADYSIVNFECTACDTSLRPIDKKFTFRTKPEWLSALKNNGITGVSLANNHSSDFGQKGLKQTVNNLNFYGLDVIGYNDNPLIIEKHTNKIAIFTSCLLMQKKDSYSYNHDLSSLLQNIRQFKQSHPDYLILVFLHWGIELQLKPTNDQIDKAHLLIDAGVDGIIGHHPHVVQVIEKYKGKYIFYSIGNFIFDTNSFPANSGLLVNFSIEDNQLETVNVFPFTIQNAKPTPMIPEESIKFIHGILTRSPSIQLKPTDNSWIVL